MFNLVGIHLICCLLASSLPYAKPDKHKPQPKRMCFHHGKHDKKCTESQTECGIDEMGASVGCMTKSECGTAANTTTLSCDVEVGMCCCQAGEKSYATACQLAAGNFTAKCRLPNGQDEECKKPVTIVACSTDSMGRGRGCKLMKDCPVGVDLYDPKCENNLCCCTPLVDRPCNDRSSSPELDIVLKEIEEKGKREDSDPNAASSPCVGKGWIIMITLPMISFI